MTVQRVGSVIETANGVTSLTEGTGVAARPGDLIVVWVKHETNGVAVATPTDNLNNEYQPAFPEQNRGTGIFQRIFWTVNRVGGVVTPTVDFGTTTNYIRVITTVVRGKGVWKQSPHFSVIDDLTDTTTWLAPPLKMPYHRDGYACVACGEFIGGSWSAPSGPGWEGYSYNAQYAYFDTLVTSSSMPIRCSNGVSFYLMTAAGWYLEPYKPISTPVETDPKTVQAIRQPDTGLEYFRGPVGKNFSTFSDWGPIGNAGTQQSMSGTGNRFEVMPDKRFDTSIGLAANWQGNVGGRRLRSNALEAEVIFCPVLNSPSHSSHPTLCIRSTSTYFGYGARINFSGGNWVGGHLYSDDGGTVQQEVEFTNFPTTPVTQYNHLRIKEAPIGTIKVWFNGVLVCDESTLIKTITAPGNPGFYLTTTSNDYRLSAFGDGRRRPSFDYRPKPQFTRQGKPYRVRVR